MSSAVMLERTGLGVPGVGVPGYGYPTPHVGTPTVPVGANYLMVPRCSSFKFEKCTGGFKLTCVCEDKVSANMVQNLCTMLAGGMLSCCCVLNGVPVCTYNFTYCMCKCEPTDSGVCITCTSGDTQCGTLCQTCCDSLIAMQNAGCTCFVLMNNTPVCCCSYEGSHAKTKK